MAEDTKIESKEVSMAVIIKSADLEPTKAEMIKNSFAKFFTEIEQYENEARSIVVKDENDIQSMSRARELRLTLQKIRTSSDKERKALKEGIVREGKVLDGIGNIIKGVIEPLEEGLEKKENYAENLREERAKRVLAERTQQLQQYVSDVSLYNLNDMADDVFANLLDGAKKAHEDKVEAERKAKEKEESDRVAKAKEDERIRLENESLKKQQLIAEEKRKDAEAKLQKERDEQAERERKLKEESDRKLRMADEEKKRLETEIANKKAEDERKAKEDADRKKKEDDERKEKERQARLAPEKDKLFDWSEQIKSIPLPLDLSVEGLKIARNAEKKLLEISQAIKEEIKKL